MWAVAYWQISGEKNENESLLNSLTPVLQVPRKIKFLGKNK